MTTTTGPTAGRPLADRPDVTVTRSVDHPYNHAWVVHVDGEHVGRVARHPTGRWDAYTGTGRTPWQGHPTLTDAVAAVIDAQEIGPRAAKATRADPAKHPTVKEGAL